MELISEPAVVTAAADAGDRERVVTFFTRGQGGVTLYAKRQPRRGAPAGLFIEPLQGGELVYQRPRPGGRGRLRGFVPQRVWPGIRHNLGRTLQAMAFLELVNICLVEGEPQAELFALLVDYLNRLEGEDRPGLARIRATLRLLALSGFAPQLERCLGCGGAVVVGASVLLTPAGGGIVCPACAAARGERTIPVTAAAHGFMVRALALSAGQARRLRVSRDAELELSRLLDAFAEARTGVWPRSGAAIERLERG